MASVCQHPTPSTANAGVPWCRVKCLAPARQRSCWSSTSTRLAKGVASVAPVHTFHAASSEEVGSGSASSASTTTKSADPPPRGPGEDSLDDAGPSTSNGSELPQNVQGPGGPDPSSRGPQQPNIFNFRLRYLVLLLAEYGGIYGTTAVIIGWLTHVDAFGGLTWNVHDILLGLQLFVPVLMFDAFVGLPDWSSRPEDAPTLLQLYFTPEAASGLASAAAQDGLSSPTHTSGQASNNGRSTVDRTVESPSPFSPTASAPATGVADHPASAPARPSTAAPTPASPPSSLWMASQRLRMALELLQMQNVRNNPAARLAPGQEVVFLLVGCLADEMLYRAVILTAFSMWLRDRFYEAGADDIIGMPILGMPVMHTADAAKWAALACGVFTGAVVYAVNAWREAAVARGAADVAAREARKLAATARLEPGSAAANAVERQALLDASKGSLAASLGLQGMLVWALEGVREITHVAMAGSAFILTGNLAAPLAGSIVTQVLSSGYQRLGMQRSLQRRIAVMARRKAIVRAMPKRLPPDQ